MQSLKVLRRLVLPVICIHPFWYRKWIIANRLYIYIYITIQSNSFLVQIIYFDILVGNSQVVV